ncbi:DUF930 domain-containing protein [Bosea sp. LjRoot9]|uniref:DUF930 domain-containing protein n=1 Tax=Bosea sp. LjRoot9 TaxID=3342341 RepID=UPI003ECFA0AE
MPASLLLHLVLLSLLGLAALRPREEIAPHLESSVDVELLSSPQFEAMIRPKPVEETPKPQPPAPQTAPEKEVAAAVPRVNEPPLEPGAMIKASRLMAAAALASPLSRQAREALPHLAEDERVEQLCGLEAMSQIHAWKAEFEPDRLVAYAMAGTKLSGRELLAEGAAFRSKQHWYALRFKCGFTPDRKQVVAFEFRVGDPVPRAQWEMRGLPASH